MNNTLENKARFFALYWGQNVLMAKTNNGGFTRYTAKDTEMHEHYLNHDCYLELKPLSQITDEDADFCLKEMGMPYRDDIVYNASKFRRVVLDKRMRTIDAATVDHLRSKGYALPWMGISVEEQIEFGWVKLKE